MKFDCIVSNPPYKQGLHLKILECAVELMNDTGQLMFVHPADWLISLHYKGKGPKYKKLRNKYSSITKSIEFFNGSEVMKCLLFLPLTITHLDKTYSDKIKFIREDKSIEYVDHLDEINPIINAKRLIKILDKIDKTNIIWDHIKIYRGDFYVNLNLISGAGSFSKLHYDGIERKTKQMYNIVNITCDFVSNSPLNSASRRGELIGNEKYWVSFASNQEAENFLGFITKTKFFKCITYMTKINQNVPNVFWYLPWLDWTQEWTDEKLYEYYNLDEEDIETINIVMDHITIKE